MNNINIIKEMIDLLSNKLNTIENNILINNDYLFSFENLADNNKINCINNILFNSRDLLNNINNKIIIEELLNKITSEDFIKIFNDDEIYL